MMICCDNPKPVIGVDIAYPLALLTICESCGALSRPSLSGVVQTTLDRSKALLAAPVNAEGVS